MQTTSQQYYNLSKLSNNPLTTDSRDDMLVNVDNRLEGSYMGNRRKHIALYGSVRLKRIRCQRCKTFAFVIEGIKQCCLEPEKFRAKKLKVMSGSSGKRKKPSPARRKEILKLQDNKCLYCNKPFGELYWYKKKLQKTKLHWDHLVPFKYSQINKDFVAACNICNNIKSDLMFDTIKEAFYYVNYRRKKKGYTYHEDLSELP